MKNYYRSYHYQSKDKNFNIYISCYTTKKGKARYHVEIFAEHLHNNNGFCSRIAKYNTSGIEMLQFIQRSDYFDLMEKVG